MFLAGVEVGVVGIYRHELDLLDQTMPGLRAETLIAGAGHWMQQEKPEEVGRRLLQYSSAVWPVR
jgi:pimeloyl-ACP methyl ester carboxylesterase